MTPGGVAERPRLAVIAAAFIALGATGARATSLEEAVKHGLDRSPEVEAAEAEVAAARTDLKISKNGYLPSLNASSGAAREGVGYDVTLAQTLVDWGEVRAVVDQKRAQLDQQEANLLIVRDDRALDIAETYLDLASARAQLAVADRHLSRLRELFTIAQTRVEARYSDLSEMGRVNLAVATAEGVGARLRGEEAEAALQYQVLLAEAPEQIRLPDPPAFLQTLSNKAAQRDAMEAAPLYRKAQMGVRVAQHRVREAKAARFPRLTLEGAVQRREIGGRMVDDAFVSVRLRMNTTQGFAAFQRPALEAQRRDAAEREAQGALREIERMLGSLGSTDEALAWRIDALNAQAEQAGGVGALYREQFLAARRDIQDLVIMETAHFEAERQAIELTVERLRLQYRAAAQIGLLTPALLAKADEEAR